MLLQRSFERGKRNICRRNRGRKNIFQFFGKSETDPCLVNPCLTHCVTFVLVYLFFNADADDEDWSLNN